jgi:hypothetical protein
MYLILKGQLRWSIKVIAMKAFFDPDPTNLVLISPPVVVVQLYVCRDD